jgi:beta-galactosidase
LCLINEYKKNRPVCDADFDLEWRGYSYGIQPDVDHFAAAVPFDIAGVDIYHPSQNQLTGTEIAFGGDLARSLKRNNYLVLETQAQGFPQWLPYPGQLRLQAFSHVAAGASMVAYWHFHSIHNSFETYWKDC